MSTFNASGIVVTSSLNVRLFPSASSPIVGVLPNGTQVEIVNNSNGWYEIKFNNSTAYVSAQYINLIQYFDSNPSFQGTKIMGKSVATPEQLKKFLLANNPNPKINCSVDKLVNDYIKIGDQEGVRGDIAFAQSLHETGYFSYGGQVLPEQNNFAGIGATNTSDIGKGAFFKNPQEGITAQIQHLKAYASTTDLVLSLVDPRFKYVKRGYAEFVEWLGAFDNPKNVNLPDDQKTGWAYPGKGYGNAILEKLNRILQIEVNQNLVTIAVDNINVRSTPEIPDNRIGTLSKGTKVTILEKLDKWYKIEFNGQIAYISSDQNFVK